MGKEGGGGVEFGGTIQMRENKRAKFFIVSLSYSQFGAPKLFVEQSLSFRGFSPPSAAFFLGASPPRFKSTRHEVSREMRAKKINSSSFLPPLIRGRGLPLIACGF